MPQLIIEVVADPRKLQRGLNQAQRSTKQFSREMEHAGRGILSGTGLMRSFGRSIAFASGGFIAFQGVSKFLTDSINAAREAAVAQRSLAAQMKASGESFTANRKRIEETALAYGKFGFQNDEVIKSLTVLERGTGHINRAIALQGLTANLARAKNLELAQAANIVAKVFGGQETALRRAVPGLDKHAHGLALIAEAQRKLKGQAEAATTPSERFQATLHDTQEIIGTALLPVVNRYLDSLTKWLDKMNRSGKLQKDLNKFMKDGTPIVSALAGVVGDLAKAFGLLAENYNKFRHLTGADSNKPSFWSKLFGGTLQQQIDDFIKRAKYLGGAAKYYAEALGIIDKANAKVAAPAGARGPVGTGITAPAGARGPVGLDSTKPAGISADERLRRILLHRQIFDARIARQLDRVQDLSLGKQRQALQNIAAEIRARQKIVHDVTYQKKLGDDLVAVLRQERSVTQDIAAQREQRRERRNQFFDTRIGRELNRLQDLGLRARLAGLKVVAQEVRDQLAIRKDQTRRNTLNDQLLDIYRQQKDVQSQITDQIQQQNQKLKDRADAIKSAIIERLQQKQQRADDAKAVKDAQATLRLYQQIGGKGGIAAARAALSAAITQQRIDVLSGQKATLTRGGVFSLGNTITVNVHGVTDPDKVARMVVAAIKRGERRTGVQSRGPTAGTYHGPH